MSNDILAGYEAAAKALAERAAGHYKLGNFDLQDECLQCAAMLHDLKPALAAATAPIVAQPVVAVDERIEKQVADWRKEVVRLNDLIAHATGAKQLEPTIQPGWRLVPISAPNEVVCAIEAMVDQQLIASGSSPADMLRQDGADIWDAALAAAPAAPTDGEA